jgi:hypothetical protein
MNSPLEIPKVRLRGLHGWVRAEVYRPGARQELSAQADIALSEPRIHFAGVCAGAA